MNILFLTKEPPYPPNNGHRNRTFHLLRGLTEKHKVALLCFGGADKNRLEEINKYCSFVRMIASGKRYKGMSLFFSILLGLFSSLPYAVKIRYSPEMKRAVEEMLASESIDCIFCDSIYQAVHLPKNIRVRKVLAEHNIESLIVFRYLKSARNPFKKTFAFIEWMKFRKLENREWKNFDACLTVSDFDKKEIERRTPQQTVSVIPNGVDTTYFNADGTIEKPSALTYMGQMNWYPNIDAMNYFLSRILPAIRKTEPVVTLSIVGHNPPQRIKSLAKRDNITITGFVKDVRPYVAQSAVFVVPLRIGSGTRLKILEAMAMGKAIVSTSIGCEGLDVADGENIIIADHPEEFANKVVELLRNPELRHKLGTNARRLVEEKYSWDKVIDKLLSVI